MAEWLYEAGIGAERAVLIEDGAIVEAVLAIDMPGLRHGAVLDMVVIERLNNGAIARGVSGDEALIDRLPKGAGEGVTIRVTIVREAISEVGAVKRAKGVVTPDATIAPAPTLLDRLIADGATIRQTGRAGPDLLEEAGWSEQIDEAARGEVAFAHGALRISLTPAMTLIDVDGDQPAELLAVAGAAAAARAIRRLGLSGSIGIDLPTVGSKNVRADAAAAIDANLPQPFERTAVNGFGFVQIVRPRHRASLADLAQGQAALVAALELLQRADRGIGAVTLVAAPPVIAALQGRPDWIEQLARHRGGAVHLQADAGRAIWASDVC